MRGTQTLWHQSIAASDVRPRRRANPVIPDELVSAPSLLAKFTSDQSASRTNTPSGCWDQGVSASSSVSSL
jgi:hypothetical protein